ncbi:MAG: 3-demethylubiquinone-9 3-O-methyltransferase [Deltaproteobacteria bacterium]|nr:3-demethylubiquinone-9 3-O-methyltransferase [Deltaproteobacteria bacterium]
MKPNDQKLYDKFAKDWWDPKKEFFALKHLNIPRFEYFDRFIPNWTGMKILDVGCGGGFASEILAEKGAIVSGIDQSEKLIEVAKQHASDNGLEINYQQGVAESLPYGDQSFDAVFCVDVLEHVNSVDATISEISRVLKPTGRLLFDTINRTVSAKLTMIWILEDLMREIPKGIHDWNKFIKPEELLETLKQSGFQSFDIRGLDIKGKDKKTGLFKTQLNDNTSVMYIGKCDKQV